MKSKTVKFGILATLSSVIISGGAAEAMTKNPSTEDPTKIPNNFIPAI